MIYPSNFENKTGFDKIRARLRAICLSPLGIQKVDNMVFSDNFEHIQQQLLTTNELKTILATEDSFPENNFYDITSVLKHLRIEGTFPEVEDMFNLRRSLETIRSLYVFFKDKSDTKYPHIWALAKDLKLYPFVSERINAIITNQGKIKDNASAALQHIRHEIQAKESDVSKRMQRIIKQSITEGWTDEGVTLSIRDGRLVIPVLAAHKRRIKGFIHDESATGRTAYIEPAEVVELNNDLKELEHAERREIVKILTTFADDIRPYIDDLLDAYNFMGIIDFLRAKARFAAETNAVLPPLTNAPVLEWNNAVHPLLYLHLRTEHKTVVPLNITLNSTQRILVISGPNAGGKSVCLQTVGLMQYMLQCGMLIGVKETSETGIFSNIFIDIGDEQSIENDLSTYSSHLLNMKHFVRNASDTTLFLIDEFGTGTEPMLGGAIAESILEALNTSRSYGVVTTHYTNLKHFAASAEGIVNGAMLYDTQKLQPLFQLLIGEPGSSFAFEIARKIGLPEQILQHATQKIGEEHIDFDRNLKDIIRDKHYWQQKRNHVKESGKRLDDLVAKYTGELDTINLLRKDILQKAKAEAQQMLSGVNKQIENTIRTIKESHADKEKSRLAREQIVALKETVNNADTLQDERIARKMEHLQKREERKQEKMLEKGMAKDVKPEPEKPRSLNIEKGDKVRLFGQATVGEALDVNGKSILVAFGHMITTLHENRLEKISKNEFKKHLKEETTFLPSRLTNYNISERKQQFKMQLDVRGKRADDALQAVAEYIDEAIVVDVNEVRVLHGKGNGILRQLIRDYLKTVDVVTDFRDEHVEFGGAGITVVRF